MNGSAINRRMEDKEANKIKLIIKRGRETK